MKDILSEIIANKRFEVDLQKQAISIEQLQEGISEVPTSRSMKQALASSASGIIAEFKRRSPSKGWIKEEACPEEIVPSYAAAGASVSSARERATSTTGRSWTVIPAWFISISILYTSSSEHLPARARLLAS